MRLRAAVLTWMVGAAALSAPAAQKPPIFRWPEIPALEGTVVKEIVHAHDVPVQISALKLRESLPRVAEIYLRAFRAAHLFVLPDKDQPQLAKGVLMLTGLDPARRISYTVMLQHNPDGTLTAIQGEAHLTELGRGVPGTDLPLFPGAQPPVRAYDESSEMVSYQAKATDREVASFYARVLGAAGYRGDPEDPGLYQRGADQVRVLTRPFDSNLQSVVLIHRLRAEAAPGR